MQTLRKRWVSILFAVLVIGGPIAWYKWPSTTSAAEASLTAPVKQGEFKVLVTTTGELRANKFVQVTGPAQAKMASVGADLAKQQNMFKNIQDVMGSFTIKAPSAGMVIYIREWNGKKKGVGSQWNAWENTVATLPDLTQMESQTYINEVDV